ncbi:16S rRNA (cytidine(1402)-2'-O)-methyltransferase [Devosia sp. ZB163]|uniref:16S rRNA (cytidine(1402)-2'-O)-methyltransferase n=1 Tax=Devosia sp. ZB163 TaxID=3025938 RepID=UPI00235EEF15|nr:16S rRNA (cytidine(1402)-2'-O)-methyltransferase [Devosia sp. ZB163]MDC9822521.1 16S rRNA (cytidine(1402)-2'-O)-methyltransferase [Devosia sp. ZB163]
MERPHSFFIAGNEFAAPPLAAGLYVVATPIGNLKDITVRALETLAAADLILCEDTRHSATLLDHYGIRTARRSLHEHNERARIGEVVAAIGEGRAVAQISDAGTPLLSDPGFPLVRGVREAGLPVFALPGPSALLAALAIAGLPTDAFGFFGFLPAKAGARANAIAALKGRTDTLVFYESPRRVADTLAAMAEILGERPAAVALELTKRFERVETGSLAELAARFAEVETKGEAVILVGGGAGLVVEEADWQAALAEALAAQPLRAAVDEISSRYGLKRKEVYDAALALKAEE